jgi:hypothetical protein
MSLAGVEGLSLAASIHTDESERYDRLVALFFGMVSQGLVSEPAPAAAPKAKKRAARKG